MNTNQIAIDSEQACEWFHNQDDWEFQAGLQYESGIDVDQNPEQFFDWLAKAYESEIRRELSL